MTVKRKQSAFTLIELLVAIAIIMILTGILVPSLSVARDLSRTTKCLTNLAALGKSGCMYQTENDQKFWPYSLANTPRPGVRCYFWGTDTNPVDTAPSPFMAACGNNLELLWCPELKWGDYIPQGRVSEPTTTYGYNGRYLNPDLGGGDCKSAINIPNPSELFVFADAAMAWKPAGVTIFQNSTYLEPISGNWNQQPTNHFRHRGKTNILTADGRAASFEPEGWDVDSETNLGFVGTQNKPHYEQ